MHVITAIAFNNPVGSAAAERKLLGCAGAPQKIRDGRDKLLRFDGLGQMDLVAGEHGAGAIFGAGEGSESDRGCFAALLFRERSGCADELVAIFHGHTNVAKNQVWTFRFQEVEAGVDRVGGDDAGTTIGEQAFDQVTGIGLVVDNENCLALQRQLFEIRRWRAGRVQGMTRLIECAANDCEWQNN